MILNGRTIAGMKALLPLFISSADYHCRTMPLTAMRNAALEEVATVLLKSMSLVWTILGGCLI